MAGSLYYGDNLTILREHVASESADLIYLDPPFNSNATYNVLFKAPTGADSRAQLEAFEDTWHWGSEAETAFFEVLQNPRYPDAGVTLDSLRKFLHENDMMAYLAMMAVRLIELHRTLKSNGSIFLHCDATASHYLKLLMDSIFGAKNYRNEIVWQRTTGKSLMSVKLPNSHDIILLYQKQDGAYWNMAAAFQEYDESNLSDKTAAKFSNRDPDGRRYSLGDLMNPNPDRPNLTYEFLGFTRVWRWTRERMEEAYLQGIVVQPSPGSVPRMKRYLDEQRGIALGDVWTDIPPLNSQAQERLGYPTQKPLALLERIIRLATKPGSVVLDPFCGCGTTIHAAQKLGLNWIGIDITHLAISLMERRLRDAFPSITFDVHGTPKDIEGARDLAERDKYQFQWWAVSLVDAVPYGGKKKGADSGIDGWRYMAASRNTIARAIISVKGGQNVSVQMVRDLRGVIEREKADAGVFVTLVAPTKPMIEEAAKAGFFDSPFGNKRHPRLQILTIEALLKGTKPNLPPLAIDAGFKRAEREDRAEQSQGSLLGTMVAPPSVAPPPPARSQASKSRRTPVPSDAG